MPFDPSTIPSRRWLRALCGLALALPLVITATPGVSDQLLNYVSATYGRSARDRLLDWQRLIASSRDETDLEKLDTVNRFFNRVRFVSDIRQWGKRDYWATPVEMLATDGGDCEDFSIAKFFTLKAMGVPEERMRITYVKALDLRQAHMVLAYYPTPEAEPLILDNLIDEIRPGSARTDLQPVYSFNGAGLWRSVARGRGRRIGSPEGLSRWRDLISRLERESAWADGSTRGLAPSEPEPDQLDEEQGFDS